MLLALKMASFTLLLPILFKFDKIWRFKLDFWKVSLSMTVIFFNPRRTRASKQAPPTPPTPTSKMLEFAKVLILFLSRINSYLSNIKIPSHKKTQGIVY